MNKILIAYVSRTGATEKMANYLAEGIRMGGNEVEIKKISEIEFPREPSPGLITGTDSTIKGRSPASIHRSSIDLSSGRVPGGTATQPPVRGSLGCPGSPEDIKPAMLTS